MTSIRQLLRDLIGFQSVTPHDAGCQQYMIPFFERIGFVCQTFDNPPVANFFARYGTCAPLLVFAGHTDVVPPGHETAWETPPFELTEKNGLISGRGVADMKGSLAAMMAMAERFVQDYPDFPGSLGFLITSGEEGDDFDKGTPHVMSCLKQEGTLLDYCVVGEPSSSDYTGDVIKTGRRGSLTGTLILTGIQGHVAYPHLAKNPIHMLSPALAELAATRWDEGNAHFPPTSFQITSIHSDGKASNIIPGELTLRFNFRFSTEQTSTGLQEKVLACLARHHLNAQIEWRLNGEPFLTSKGKLLESTIQAISSVTGKQPLLSTSGGTSDGRFIAPYGVEVLELGPVNASIHQVNECVKMSDLEQLEDMYYRICQNLFLGGFCRPLQSLRSDDLPGL